MILVPTRVCNTNRCNYCGVHKKDFDTNYFDDLPMTDFFAKIRFMAESAGDYELRFFGGEPFLRFDTMKRIIEYFKSQSSLFRFAINTNLGLLDRDKMEFLKNHNVKLIISCNGGVETHSKSRGVSMQETLNLYKNMKAVMKNDIEHQINIVVQEENAHLLTKNILFIQDFLWGRTVNLLPVNYNGWTCQWLDSLKKSFDEIYRKIQDGTVSVHFINKDVNNKVPLFNSELVVDSDGRVYPSMVILETFFLKEKEKIRIADLRSTFDELKNDLLFFENENNEIYSRYINKVLKSKFSNIIGNDHETSALFHQFLTKI